MCGVRSIGGNSTAEASTFHYKTGKATSWATPAAAENISLAGLCQLTVSMLEATVWCTSCGAMLGLLRSQQLMRGRLTVSSIVTPWNLRRHRDGAIGRSSECNAAAMTAVYITFVALKVLPPSAKCWMMDPVAGT
eukprot:COSAG01_NODE_4139_length_5306_cov_4.761283_6_plen_135_part_00